MKSSDEKEDLIMVSAIEHFSYCPRQCALIHIEQCFDENVFTMRGHAAHDRVDDPGYEHRPGMRVERALPIWSDRLALVGRCDVVEFDASGTPYPIEYKHGPRRTRRHDDLQLAAQAICLEEMTDKAVPRGAIFHVSSRRRREVTISGQLRRDVEETVAVIRSMLNSGILPSAPNDERCAHCSLKEICQPEAMANLAGYRELSGGLFDPET
jgi:CRISPR-associated exonuclease Cas4